VIQRIPGYQPGDGDEVADRALADISKMFGGYIPNFHKILAQSPPVVTAFEAMRRTLQGTKIRAIEREIIALEVSRRSNCEYCIAAHSKFARAFKIPASDLEALLSGRPMADPRNALVQRATQRLIDTQGRLSDPELAEFRAGGLSDGELIEIVAVIGWYILSTYVNNLAHTEVDKFWTK
jgi:AhpD family alkylhydroperoxidase